MPHVAVLFEFPTLNGGERSMLAVLDILRQSGGFRFSAIAPATGDLADALSSVQIPVHPLTISDGKQRLPPAAVHDQMRSIIRQQMPDILHGNSLSMARLSGQIDFDNNAPPIRTGHLRDIIRLNARVISDLNANDGLIAVSRATQRFHVDQGLHAACCQVIYNGVDTNLFRRRETARVRAKILPSLSSSDTLLLNVGQICLRKGQLKLAKSVCEILQHRDDIHLMVAGARHSTKDESIAFEAAVIEEFAKIGRTSHLHMLGYRDDVHLLMSAADMLVHTAHQEPFGRTLLEAAASGLPIIATDVGGTSEMLRHDQDAILLNPAENAALTGAIHDLIDDTDRKNALATSARNRIRDQFTVDRAATELGKFWASAEDLRKS